MKVTFTSSVPDVPRTLPGLYKSTMNGDIYLFITPEVGTVVVVGEGSSSRLGQVTTKLIRYESAHWEPVLGKVTLDFTAGK